MVGGKDPANIIGREKKRYVWKMHHCPTGAGADGRLPLEHPAAGSAQGTAGRSEHTAELWAGRGREHNSSLYCTFRVSLLGRDMEHLPPLAWVGTPSPKQPFPKPPDLSHTDLHIPSVKENMGLGVCGFDKYVD